MGKLVSSVLKCSLKCLILCMLALEQSPLKSVRLGGCAQIFIVVAKSYACVLGSKSHCFWPKPGSMVCLACQLQKCVLCPCHLLITWQAAIKTSSIVGGLFPCSLILSHYLFQRTLEREVQQCQALVIWTDCDREGENIGFEIINVCKAGVWGCGVRM